MIKRTITVVAVYAAFVGGIVTMFSVNKPPQSNISEYGYNRDLSPDLLIDADTIEIDRATVYHPVKEQCNDNPLVTADMSKIDLIKLKNKQIRWVALSRNLIARWGGPIEYGDTIRVISEQYPQVQGYWIVHDCMNARYKNAIDFLTHPTNKVGIVWPNKVDIKIII